MKGCCFVWVELVIQLWGKWNNLPCWGSRFLFQCLLHLKIVFFMVVKAGGWWLVVQVNGSQMLNLNHHLVSKSTVHFTDTHVVWYFVSLQQGWTLYSQLISLANSFLLSFVSFLRDRDGFFMEFVTEMERCRLQQKA